jgi:hypothetical protein
MAFQFALEVQGVSTCCINWPDMAAQEHQMAQALGLRPDERVVMLISLGYPDPEGMVPYSQKKPLDEICSYNRTGPAFKSRAGSTPVGGRENHANLTIGASSRSTENGAGEKTAAPLPGTCENPEVFQ